MCESNVYMLKNGKEELILENVDFLENNGKQVKIIDIFGDKKMVRAKVKTLSLVEHKIILEPQ